MVCNQWIDDEHAASYIADDIKAISPNAQTSYVSSPYKIFLNTLLILQSVIMHEYAIFIRVIYQK